MGDNGAATCAQHEAAIGNLLESARIQGERSRDFDARIQAQDGTLGQILVALGDARIASDKARDQASLTLTRVQELAQDVRREMAALGRRIAELETPARGAMPSGLDYLSEDTKANAISMSDVRVLRDLNDARERAAAAEAALATRNQISERAASGARTDADAALKRWKVLASVALAALGTLGSIAAAYFAAKGG